MPVDIDPVDLYLERVRYALSMGHGSLARTLLRQALDLAPQDDRLWVLLGSITLDQRRALSYFRRGQELNSRNIQAQTGVAWLKGISPGDGKVAQRLESHLSDLRVAAVKMRYARSGVARRPQPSPPSPSMPTTSPTGPITTNKVSAIDSFTVYNAIPVYPKDPKPQGSTRGAAGVAASASGAPAEKATAKKNGEPKLFTERVVTTGLKRNPAISAGNKKSMSGQRNKDDNLALSIVADALFVVGAILVIVGSGLPWFRLEGSEAGYIWIGYQGSGLITVALGALTFLLIAIGLVRGRLGLGIASLVLFVGCGVITVIASSSLWFVQQIVQAPYELTAVLFSLDLTQSHSPGIGWGLVGVSLGGLLLILGGLLQIRSSQ